MPIPRIQIVAVIDDILSGSLINVPFSFILLCCRDWYVYTASPQKKNVVIVVDESGSMGSAPIIGMMGQNTTQRVDIAKAAARTVLDTLSPTDHVSSIIK